MGMFDSIAVAEKLPLTQEMIDLGLEDKLHEFQTKDLYCSLDLYFMQNGRLFIEKHKEIKWIEGDKKAKDLMSRIGSLQKIEPYQEDTHFHGKFNFYDFKTNVADKYDCTIEFCALYDKGQLEEIKLVRFEKTDNTARKERESAWQKEIDRVANIWYNKYLKFNRIKTYIGYNFFYKPLTWLANKIHRIAAFFI
jgi:hypothetical protein